MTFTIRNFLNNKISLWAGLVSVLFSIIAYSGSDPLNYDGILYLTAADTFLKSGFQVAMGLYPWPFYSIVIGCLSAVTHLSFQQAAELLNSLFLAITTVAFISLVKKIKNEPSLQIAAAVIILAFAGLNHYRDLIVRDFGYWAFLLVAINQFVNFARTNRWYYAITWTISIVCATLFRIEGAIIFIFAPFALLGCQQLTITQRFTAILKLFSLAFIGAVFYLLWHHLYVPHTNAEVGRITELVHQFTVGWQAIFANFQVKINAIKTAVLDYASVGDAPGWFIFGFSGMFMVSVLSAFSVLYALLLFYALIKAVMPATDTVRILVYLAILNLIIALLFYAQHLFLSSRYLIAACLILASWPVFALQTIYQDWQNHEKRWLFWLTGLWLLINMAGSVISFGHSKAYITEAGAWLRQNTPLHASLYSNNKQILFYAERTGIDWNNSYDDSNPLNTLQHTHWLPSDYVAIRIKHEDARQYNDIIKMLGQQPLKIFKNKRGDQVLIFKLAVKKGGLAPAGA